MRLYLVRHGIAVDGLGGGITSDAQRPLTQTGIDEMKIVAKSLTKLGIKPDLILASPLTRTRETAQIIAEAFDMTVEHTDSLAPMVDPSRVWKAFNRFPDAQEIFLVGHEPDMGMLVGTLCFAGAEWHMPFKKGGVCRVDVGAMPPDSPGSVKWYLTPKICKSL